MKHVAKLVIIDESDEYLMLYRSDHPEFGNDPDLPGGTVEAGESMGEAMVREVEEEAGITIAVEQAKQIYSGTDYSENDTHYALYITKLQERPKIVMSWEHSGYEWLTRKEIINIAKHARDTYMHMAADMVAKI